MLANLPSDVFSRRLAYLKSEDTRTDGQSISWRIEEYHCVIESIRSQERDIVVVDVDKTDEYENIRKQSSGSQLADISDERQGNDHK